jgi:hypothetical protein
MSALREPSVSGGSVTVRILALHRLEADVLQSLALKSPVAVEPIGKQHRGKWRAVLSRGDYDIYKRRARERDLLA